MHPVAGAAASHRPFYPDNPYPARPVRARAARSLRNTVHAHPSDKHCKKGG